MLSHNVVVNPKYCCTRSSIRRRAEEEWEKRTMRRAVIWVKNKRRISVRRAIAAPGLGLGHGRTHGFAHARSLPYGLRLRRPCNHTKTSHGSIRMKGYIHHLSFLFVGCFPPHPSICMPPKNQEVAVIQEAYEHARRCCNFAGCKVVRVQWKAIGI